MRAFRHREEIRKRPKFKKIASIPNVSALCNYVAEVSEIPNTWGAKGGLKASKLIYQKLGAFILRPRTSPQDSDAERETICQK